MIGKIKTQYCWQHHQGQRDRNDIDQLAFADDEPVRTDPLQKEQEYQQQ